MKVVSQLAALLGAPDHARPVSASLSQERPEQGPPDPADTTREAADEAYFRMLCMAFVMMAG